MSNYSIDTNAILDFCYRFYPEKTFPSVWAELEAAIYAKHCFIFISESIHTECLQRISAFGFELSVFNDFKSRMHIKIIQKDDFGSFIICIQKLLREDQRFSSSDYATGSLADIDVISLARAVDGVVLTSERGHGLNKVSAKHRGRAKIPDVCEFVQVDCCDLVALFDKIGMKL